MDALSVFIGIILGFYGAILFMGPFYKMTLKDGVDEMRRQYNRWLNDIIDGTLDIEDLKRRRNENKNTNTNS